MRAVGRYRVLGKLASGGMAEVYLAEAAGAAGFRKQVALKLVRGDFAGSPEHLGMFLREARLAARLSHANVVQVFELGEDGGRPFIAMELVRGHHLGRVVERCREAGVRLGIARAVFVAAEVATALAHAHAAGGDGAPGLVHRDVSPQNVLLSFEGEVKLADFGIARAASPAGLTRPGGLEGKVAYVAPEQARGEPADARADCFALGVVLWELLAGRRLFARESEAATLEALLRGPEPSPPSHWNEEVPPALDALVLELLERDPVRRRGDARAVAAELRALQLSLARSPGDWEMRPLMWRLWPEGPPAGPGDDGAEGTPARAEAPADPTLAAPASTAADGAPTLALPPPPRRGRALAVATLAVGLAAAAAALTAGRSAFAPPPLPRPAPAAAAEAPSPGPAPPAVETAGAAVPTVPTAPAAAAEAAPGAALPATAAPYRLPLPAEASGEGILVVHATPWGTLVVDGRRLGDTPREVRLPAGRHAVRVEHPRLGAVESTLHVTAGRRGGWFPRLDARR